jgi:hypothetical protein
MNRYLRFAVVAALALLVLALVWNSGAEAQTSQATGSEGTKVISAEDCTSERLGTTIPPSAIGEAVAGVTLAAPKWVSTGNAKLYGVQNHFRHEPGRAESEPLGCQAMPGQR